MSAVTATRSLPSRFIDRLRASPWLLPAGAVLFVIVFLLPVIHAPFFSDDITGSEIPGYRTLTGKTFLGLDAELVWNFVAHSGRPQIFSGWLGYPALSLLGDHPVAYHVYLLAFTALDGALIYALLRRLRAPAAAAALAVVLAAAWMQFRIYHDSMISFAGLMQFVTALVAASLWCFARWLDEGRRRDLVFAAALFFVACGTYEVAYSLCFAHIGLALARRRGRAAFSAAAPFIGIAIVFVLATLVLRRVDNAVATGYTVGSGGPWIVLRTYVMQLISPLPAMSIVADPSITGDPDRGELFASVWRGVAVAAGVGALGVALARARVRWAPIVAVGAGLYLGPPVLLSFAGKYQTELSLGTAYLPVLMQVFALAILATAAFGALLQLATGRSRAMVAAVIAGAAIFAGLSGGVSAFNNIRVIGIIQPDRAARQLVEASAGRGAFDKLPARTSVFFWDNDMVWEGPTSFESYLYAELMLAEKTGRAYDARVLPAPGPGFAPGSCSRDPNPIRQQPICAPPAAHAAWSRVQLRPDGGTVIVAPLAHPSPTGFPSSTSQATLIVYRQTKGSRPDPPRLVGRIANQQPWSSDGLRWRRLAGGKTWALYSVNVGNRPRPIASSLADDHAFIDFLALPAPPVRARLLGTRHLLP